MMSLSLPEQAVADSVINTFESMTSLRQAEQERSSQIPWNRHPGIAR